MLNWKAENSEGDALIARCIPSRKKGMDDAVCWEIDFVSGYGPADQLGLFPGAKAAIVDIDSDQFSHCLTKVQFVQKDVQVEIRTAGGELLLDAGGEIRFAKLPLVKGKALATARVKFPSIGEDASNDIVGMLGHTMSVKVSRKVVELKMEAGELPFTDELVTGRDANGTTWIGRVVSAEVGHIEIADFQDRHILVETASGTELVSDDEHSVEDLLDSFQGECASRNLTPSFSYLIDALVSTAADGDVSPATATTTFINAAVIERTKEFLDKAKTQQGNS